MFNFFVKRFLKNSTLGGLSIAVNRMEELIRKWKYLKKMKMFCHFSILDFIFTPDCIIRNFFKYVI